MPDSIYSSIRGAFVVARLACWGASKVQEKIEEKRREREGEQRYRELERHAEEAKAERQRRAEAELEWQRKIADPAYVERERQRWLAQLPKWRAEAELECQEFVFAVESKIAEKGYDRSRVCVQFGYCERCNIYLPSMFPLCSVCDEDTLGAYALHCLGCEETTIFNTWRDRDHSDHWSCPLCGIDWMVRLCDEGTEENRLDPDGFILPSPHASDG